MLQDREYFQGNPTRLDISRSKFPLNHKFTTTAKSGYLYSNFCYQDVLPGDTFKMDLSFVCRSTTPIAPVMDDQEIQIEFYFVPHKLVLSRAYMSPSISDANKSFAAWLGAQDSLLNMPLPADVLLPSLKYDSSITKANQIKTGILHQLGYPAGGPNGKASGSGEFFSPLGLLAFYSVWSEYFREPNLWNPVTYQIITDSDSPTGAYVQFMANPHAGIVSGSNPNIGIGANNFLPPAVARYHGYFGSCLPWPQRNLTTVNVPLGTYAPVYSSTSALQGSYPAYPSWAGPLVFTGSGGSAPAVGAQLRTQGNTGFTTFYDDSQGNQGYTAAYPRNLYADLSNAAGASVNVLRLAIATQRLYEAWARGGNRLQDMTAVFGVVPHDMGDDRPEFLGGKRIPLNVTQVNNTAGTTVSTSTQMSIGSTGAFSNTSDTGHYFTKSFDTWGTIIGVYCIRHKDTFPNMLQRQFSRKDRLSLYWPQYANLGEQPVLKKELEFTGSSGDQDVFGYQEAYAEFRYLPDRISGCVNPIANAGIDYWTYSHGNLTATQKTLSGFLDARDQVGETDQTLQVSDSAAGFQYLLQFYFDITAVRPMPLYSIPGLMDHH